jgi:hypothetical protein
MTGGTWNQYPEAVAMTLSRAFPAYSVTVRRDRGEPRFQLVSRDGRNPVCLISPDPEEIRAVLNGEQVTNG